MAGPFTPNPDDGAIEVLRLVFGKVIDQVIGSNVVTVNSASANMLAEAFRYFNSGVLFFGSVILTWVAVFSVVNTANDGEALGKKWSSFYTPLRAFASAAALIPTGSGYATVQLIILLIVSWSIGLASNMWSGIVAYTVGDNVVEQAVKSVTDDPNFETLAVDALRMQICAYSVNSAINAAMRGSAGNEASNLGIEKTNSLAWDFTTKKHITKIFYRDPTWPGSENICGQITLSNTNDIDTSSNTTAATLTSLQNAITSIRTKYVEGMFPGKNGSASSIGEIANAIITAVETDGAQIDSAAIAVRLAAIRKQQLEEIKAAVTREVKKENESLIKSLSGKGWIYAGSLHTEMARIKDSIRAATSVQSQFTPGSMAAFQERGTDAAKVVNLGMQKYNLVVAEVGKKVLEAPRTSRPDTPMMPKLQTNFSETDFSSGSGGIITSMKSTFSSFGQYLVAKVVGHMSDDDTDPIMRVKNVGDTTATVAETILVAKGITVASLSATKAGVEGNLITSNLGLPAVVTAVLTFLTELWSILAPSIYTFLYAGYFLGMWIPMVPFFIFALGVVGWLVFVFEMLAAGMLWAAAHTTPAREDSFIGSQTQGYLLVLSGFFRPALMVLGLVGSTAILYPAVEYINQAFLLAFRSAQADSVTGLLSVAGYLVIYAFIIFSVFMTVFALPQTLPDRILRWIGAGIGDLGEQGTAQRIEQGASGMSRTAAVAASSKKAAFDNERNKNSANNAGVLRANLNDEASTSSSPEKHVESHTSQGALDDMPPPP